VLQNTQVTRLLGKPAISNKLGIILATIAAAMLPEIGRACCGNAGKALAAINLSYSRGKQVFGFSLPKMTKTRGSELRAALHEMGNVVLLPLIIFR
jgi:hypothetical protein